MRSEKKLKFPKLSLVKQGSNEISSWIREVDKANQ